MATRLTDEFPARTKAPTAAYPDGSYMNETAPGANDGTPLDERIGDDYEGLKQSLLAKAGITPNGQPDSVTNPQQLSAIEKFDSDRQKETTGLSDITDASIGLDIFPLIGQGLRVAGVGLWVVPSVTADGSPMPNPSLLDSVPTSSNTSVTINGASDTVKLAQFEIFAGSVDTFSSKSFPIGAVVKTSFYRADGDPVKGLKYYVKSPSVADGYVNHNDDSGNLLELVQDGVIHADQAGVIYNDLTNDYSANLQAINDVLFTPLDIPNDIYTSGGEIHLGTGTINGCVELDSGVGLIGNGYYASTLRMPDGKDTTVIKSRDFDTLTGSGKWFIADGVPYGMRILDLMVDGNKSNNTSGSGVELFAKNYIVDNVFTRDCPGRGFYSEAGSITGQSDFRDMPEASIKKIQCRNNDGIGFEFRGPHNAQLGHVISAFNGDWGFWCGTDGNTTYDGNYDECENVHTYANAGDKEIYIDTVVAIDRVIADGGNIFITNEGSNTRLGRVKILNGGGEFDALTCEANDVSIDDLFISMTANNPDPVRSGYITGNDFQCSKIRVSGNGQSTLGFVIEGIRSKITSGSIVDFNNSDAMTLDSSNATLTGVSFVNNLNAFNYIQGNRNSVDIDIVANAGQTAVSGGVPSLTDRFDITTSGAGTSAEKTWFEGESPTFAVDAVGIVNVTVPHGMLYTPRIDTVTATVKRSSNVTYEIGFVRIASVDATNIELQVNVTTAAAGGSLARLSITAGV